MSIIKNYMVIFFAAVFILAGGSSSEKSAAITCPEFSSEEQVSLSGAALMQWRRSYLRAGTISSSTTSIYYSRNR